MKKIKSNIKLVIWDMDETFWDGVISENEISIKQSNVETIKKLVDRGIMCSISSKNDYKVVKDKLTSIKIWDLFVFPKINWRPKAFQIKQTIDDCKLRPINVLFIDDNPSNLGEVEFLLPDINLMTPNHIASLLDSEYMQGNDDKKHTRLKQFKILEKKTVERKNSISNEDFLYNSNIKVDINYDCSRYKDRLLDLINRSNQLNYTKIRLTTNEFDKLLSDDDYKNAYISVKDKYGDYGIVGFVSIDLNKNIARHFLFSCRTIGMGIEQYVYSYFGYPKILQVGDVISNVEEKSSPSWINQKKFFESTEDIELNVSVLLHGGCDLSQCEPYLNFRKLTTEFNILKYHRDHTVFAIDNFFNYKELTEFKEKIPFIWEKDFETQLFEKKHDVVIISVLQDYTQCVYQYKKNKNIKIAYDYFLKPYNENYTGEYSIEELRWFLDHFEPLGRISDEEFLKNLEFIRKNIGNDTILIIINGAEIPHERNDEIDQYKVHIKMNRIVDQFVANSLNTYLLDIRKFVTKRGQLLDSIRHYERNVYYNIALELKKIICSAIRK